MPDTKERLATMGVIGAPNVCFHKDDEDFEDDWKASPLTSDRKSRKC